MDRTLDARVDLIVWGGGNHPVMARASGRDGVEMAEVGRVGVNDAAVVIDKIFKPVCKDSAWMLRDVRLANGTAARMHRIYWQVPHYRFKPEYEDENVTLMDEYSAKTSAYLNQNCRCSLLETVWRLTLVVGSGMPTYDARYFTGRMIETLTASELETMKRDSAHWLRAVNVIKAQILLNQLAREYGA